jgi:putative secretion ATPase (PEP-CTERM system associated)
MYEEFFRLRENPFSVTPDPRFLYMGPSYRDGLAYLKYGVREKKGFLVLTGEVGTGKTTLIRALSQELAGEAAMSVVLNTRVTPKQLLMLAAQDFGLEGSRRGSKVELIVEISEFLLRQAESGRSCVLVVDEAHNMGPQLLEELRLLSNVETDRQKLLQILLVGQPELLETLSLPSVRQIRQRIPGSFHIKLLDDDEVECYVNTRLSVAGADSRWLSFTPDAFKAIHSATRGIPRLINILCDRTLLVAFVAERREISSDGIVEAVQDLSWRPCEGDRYLSPVAAEI